MNKKGFTLVELLATLVILGIVIGIALASANGGFKQTKEKTEDVFIKTIEDALNIYLNSDGKRLSFNTSVTCNITKRFGPSKIYKNSTAVTINDIINSDYTPITEGDLVNPANDKVACKTTTTVNIYRDSEYVYYYRIKKSDLGCLKNTTGYITNLPSGCSG